MGDILRIGLNTLAYVPGRSGGDGTYIRELCHALARRSDGNEYVLFVSQWNRHHLPQPSASIKHVACRLPGKSFTLRIAFEQSLLPVLAQRERLDALHCPVNVAPLAGRTPVVLTLHEAEPFMKPQDLPLVQRRYWQIMRRASANKAISCLTVSETARSELIQYMGVDPAKLAAISLGIDHERFRPVPERWHKLPPGMPESGYILWLGRSYPRKNLQRLISAFGLLKERGYPQKLLLAGPNGWEDEPIAALIAKLGLSSEVIRHDNVPFDELPQLYSGAGIFAFPSLLETFGLPIIEAMACGTPVLTSNRGAMKEIAGDAALLVDPESVTSMAEGMARILDGGDLDRELRSKGIARARLFDWNETAARTVEVYRHVCRPRS